MVLYGALTRQIKEVPVAYFKNRLIQDILAGASHILAMDMRRSRSTYGTPNLNSLMRLGTESTTCSFTAADATDGCIGVIATED